MLFSLRHVRVSKFGLLFDEKGVGIFYLGPIFVASWFQHEYVRAVTASNLLWAQCNPFHCTTLNNNYTRYADIFCQCRFEQRVMAYLRKHCETAVSRIVGIAAAKLKPLILHMPGFSFSVYTFISINMV